MVSLIAMVGGTMIMTDSWKPIKCYPRDFSSKKEEFEYYIPVQTTVHLERILDLFPAHRSRKAIEEELERRKSGN